MIHDFESTHDKITKEIIIYFLDITHDIWVNSWQYNEGNMIYISYI